MKHAVLWVACTALAGCHAGYGYRYHGAQGATVQGAYSQVSAVDLNVAVARDGGAGAILIGVLLAGGMMQYYLGTPDGAWVPYYRVPDADPQRRIHVQDCTQPIDLTAAI